jgi:hypothetical protein
MRYQEDLGRQTGCSGKESYSWEEKASSYVAQLASQSLAKFADEFGVSEESLRQLGIGFDQYAYTFPMMNAQGQVVGIRYRPQKDPHSKTTAEGSKVGLFIPKGVTGASLEIICEGETDTAASLTLGFRAIGTPFSSYSPHEIITFLRDCPVACPCIIGDNYPSGRIGA